MKEQNQAHEGKHHLGDFLPTEELEKFMTRVSYPIGYLDKQ